MQYAVKGSDADWAKALGDKGNMIESKGTVQIKGKGNDKKLKRKIVQEDVDKELGIETKQRGDLLAKKDKKKKKRKKQ